MLKNSIFIVCDNVLWLLCLSIIIPSVVKTINKIINDGGSGMYFHLVTISLLGIALVIGSRKVAKSITDIVRKPR